MKIVELLKHNSYIALGVMIIVIISAGWLFLENERAGQNLALVNEMRKVTMEGMALRDDYLLNQEGRALQQWKAKIEAFRGLLGAASGRLVSEENRLLLRQVREEFEETVFIFTRIAEKRASLTMGDTKLASLFEAEIIRLSQLYIQTYSLNDDIARLHSLNLTTLNATRRNVILAMLALFVCAIATTVTTSVLVIRKVTSRLAALNKGVGIIGNGDLDYRISIQGDDELAGLARASNEMAARLRASHTSVENLKNEIVRRIKAEEEMIREKATAQRYLDIANVILGALNEDGKITMLNKKGCSIFGYEEPELLGKDWFETCLPESVRQKEQERFRALMAGEEFTDAYHENDVITKNGAKLIIAFHHTILVDDSGGINGILFSGDEITERKRLEDALERRVAALTSPMQNLPDLQMEDLFNLAELQKIQDAFSAATGVASLITDVQGQPITKPSNFCDLCQNVIRTTEKGMANCFRSDSKVGKLNSDGPSMQICLSGGLWDGGASIQIGDQHIANWLVGQVLDESCDFESLMTYAREIGADEDEYHRALAKVTRMPKEQFEKVCQALFLIAGQLSSQAIQNVQQAQFISDLKRLEEQLLHSQKMEAVGQLAGGVAHDFNNILTVIMGYCSLIQKKAGDDHKWTQDIQQIIAAVERGANLTRGLLAFSRKQAMQLETRDLNDIVRSVQSFLSRIIGEDVHLKTNCCDMPLRVHVDGGQVEQALINLATNARDAMPKGGALTITTEQIELDTTFVRAHGYGTTGQFALITVSDSGRGMDEDTQKKIFEPFFTTKDAGKGTGLGLSIVYGVVKQHSGFINVYSELGKGTIFRVYLPIMEMNRTADEATENDISGLGTETILVVEDEDAVRKVVETLLTQFGYNVIMARDGQEGVDQFFANREKIELVLMDIIMPGMNGREATEQIRKLCPECKVLFTSGYTADIIQSRGELEEGAEIIMKPVKPIELLRKIREMLDQ